MFAPLLVAVLSTPLAPQEEAAPADPPAPGPLRTREGGEAPEDGSDRGTLDGMPDAPAAQRQRDGRPDRRARDGRLEPQLVPPDRGDYALGVYAYNTSEGVAVTGVIPGSPAARVGLERGDRIITVDGFQVGYVRGRLYPLGREIRRRADRRGEVTLLVQNVRNRQLLNVDVRTGRGGPGIPRRPVPFEAPESSPGDRLPDVLRDRDRGARDDDRLRPPRDDEERRRDRDR
ncbi:PDZ domain-containing protein [Alienimonas sp. DA493]|uniref:PDZ domain-containing protein n=1 Tax=Alienimonas sp. DA493 TaxID=3373605 RepID=UPI00375531CC